MKIRILRKKTDREYEQNAIDRQSSKTKGETTGEPEFFLAASLIYRALMEDILARAILKYYTHGVRYLKKLDALALKIESWCSLPSHDDYFEQLKKDHFRKSAFWKKYDGK